MFYYRLNIRVRGKRDTQEKKDSLKSMSMCFSKKESHRKLDKLKCGYRFLKGKLRLPLHKLSNHSISSQVPSQTVAKKPFLLFFISFDKKNKWDTSGDAVDGTIPWKVKPELLVLHKAFSAYLCLMMRFLVWFLENWRSVGRRETGLSGCYLCWNLCFSADNHIHAPPQFSVFLSCLSMFLLVNILNPIFSLVTKA